MGEWWKAEKWERCANEDFKAMYQYFIKKKGLDWCLTSNFMGFEGMYKVVWQIKSDSTIME